MISDVHMNAMDGGTNPLIGGGSGEGVAFGDGATVSSALVTPSMGQGQGHRGSMSIGLPAVGGVNPMLASSQRHSVHTRKVEQSNSVAASFTVIGALDDQRQSIGGGNNAEHARMRLKLPPSFPAPVCLSPTLH